MSALIFTEDSPSPLSICPRCGRQVRIDGHCECEAVFFSSKQSKA